MKSFRHLHQKKNWQFDLENDLLIFKQLWHKREMDPNCINDHHYLESLAKAILLLDHHAQELSKEEGLSKSASLIQYLLETPWGAPFVSEITLLEAAKASLDQKDGGVILGKLLTQFDEYKGRSRPPVVESLHEIQKEIGQTRKKAA